jgi:pimeloyl-ACP methyl ester carboxylesterase
MADDIARLLDHLGIQKADLFGYSMGARISLCAAPRHRDRFRSLIAGGIGAGRTGRNAAIGAGMRAAAAEAVEDPVAKGFRRLADVTGADLEAMAAIMEAHRPQTDLQALATFDPPALIVHGTEDSIAVDVEALVRALPSSRLVTVPGRDHVTLVADPAFKTAVVDFLSAL